MCNCVIYTCFFLRMCTYLYLYLYRYLYLYLYDDETYLRPTGNSLIYSGRGFRRSHKTWSVVPKSWTSDSSENGEGLDGLDPSLFHRPFGAESWGSMGNQWEINGKSLWKSPKWSGELWRAIVTIVLDGHQWRNHLLSLDRRNFLAARYDASRRVGVELPWHPMEDRELEPAEAGFQGTSWGAQAEGDEPLGPLTVITLRTWIRFISIYLI